MGMEERRKMLIAANPTWGDAPPQNAPPQRTQDQLQPPNHDPGNAGRAQSALDTGTPCNMSSVLFDRATPAKSFVSSKDWNLSGLIQSSPNFRQVPRVSASHSVAQVQAAIDEFEHTGEPLIIEGLHKHPGWRRDLFDIEWFRQHGPKGMERRHNSSLCHPAS